MLSRIFVSSPVEQVLIYMNDFLRLRWSRRSLKTDKSGMNIFFCAKKQSRLLYPGMLNSVWLLEERIAFQSRSITIRPKVNNLFHGKAIKSPYYVQICTIYCNSEVNDHSKKKLVLFLTFGDNSVNSFHFTFVSVSKTAACCLEVMQWFQVTYILKTWYLLFYYCEQVQHEQRDNFSVNCSSWT